MLRIQTHKVKGFVLVLVPGRLGFTQPHPAAFRPSRAHTSEREVTLPVHPILDLSAVGGFQSREERGGRAKKKHTHTKTPSLIVLSCVRGWLILLGNRK